MLSLFYLLDKLLGLFQLLLLARIMLTWIRGNLSNPWIRLLCRVTDPYLNLFRSILPSFGCVDFSPVLALLALVILRRILM